MTMPVIDLIPDAVDRIPFASRVIDDLPMDLFNEFDGQPSPRLTPSRVGEVFVSQMPHRRAGDIAVRDLPHEQPQGVAGREDGVAERNRVGTGKLIDTSRQEKII